MTDMDKINNKCRTCFNEPGKGMQSLTKMITDEGRQKKSFAEILNEVAKINIYNDKSSELPQAICGCCSRKLRAAHAFVQQAQEVNEKLCSMFQQSDNDYKPLDSLQEIQIDIGSCAAIKTERDSASECGRDVDVMAEEEFLKRVFKFEQGPDEDTLADTISQSEGNPENGKSTRDFLDVIYPDISITEMHDNESTALKSCQQTMAKSDNISNNKSSSSSASDDDDDDWLNDYKSCSTKSSKKKIKPSIKHKSGITEKIKEKNLKNKDELELKIQCKHCDAKFSRRHNMYAHMRRTHKTENLEEIQLQPKKEKSEKKFPCEQCPRSYTNKYKLIAHITKHHDPDKKNNPPKEKILQPKKRFLCTLCGLKFDSTGNLNIHFRRHTGEKPFKCEFCDRAYPRLYDVTVHRRTHTGEKPYQCTLCEKTFRQSTKLKVHMRTHTNERPYKCTECEKAFKQSKDLNIHKRTHTGERPYKCSVCDSTFTQSNSLRLHQMKQHHLEKPNVMDNMPEGAGTTTASLSD